MNNSNLVGIVFIAVAGFLILDLLVIETGISATIFGGIQTQLIDDLSLQTIWKKNTLTYYINTTDYDSKTATNIIDSTITKQGSTSGNEIHSWQEALIKINKVYPDNRVPDKIIKTANPDADIIITLLKDDNGKIAGTTYRTTHNFKGMIKAEILLYDVDRMPGEVLESVTRHEFGHALGLPHTDRTVDVMKEELKRTNIKISFHNLKDLYEIYK